MQLSVFFDLADGWDFLPSFPTLIRGPISGPISGCWNKTSTKSAAKHSAYAQFGRWSKKLCTEVLLQVASLEQIHRMEKKLNFILFYFWSQFSILEG
jgi:hypothetical protein